MVIIRTITDLSCPNVLFKLFIRIFEVVVIKSVFWGPLAGPQDHATLDLRIMCLRPTLGVEMTKNLS